VRWRGPANVANVVNFAILANPSAELELALADSEGLDLGFERGGRYAKLGRGT
jgi:hypothetical protein